ncbi:hypothetical protein L596_008966 [Steinernema carpocapsae]|uniref:Uncharacterized protein n=1 Tax=Steinernema carpocapsae TaxID=34508 RepID=A0A4U5PDZ9_STECR|nr:hypothetical protein L596_008966 [Steinernema carpocapsae]
MSSLETEAGSQRRIRSIGAQNRLVFGRFFFDFFEITRSPPQDDISYFCRISFGRRPVHEAQSFCSCS